MLVLRSQLDRGFDRFFDRALEEFTQASRPSNRGVVELDLLETEEAFLISADVPGMKRDEIELTIEDNQLTLKGQRELNSEVEAQRHLSERKSYAFSRRFELPSNVAAEQTEASLAEGVLQITVPKLPEEAPKTIQIQDR